MRTSQPSNQKEGTRESDLTASVPVSQGGGFFLLTKLQTFRLDFLVDILSLMSGGQGSG